MIILARNALEKRATTSQAVVWIVVFTALIGTLLLLLFARTLWKWRRGRARSADSNVSQRSKSSFQSFLKHFIPQQRYMSRPMASDSQQPHAESNHEMQTEESQQTNRMSSNRLSVRSIMTLPPYHVAPLPSERLIAREGERAGVDLVVEYPETDGELEERREEEMQTLFNIREARRREQQERSARREERRRAMLQGDWRRVQDIDREDRARQQSRNESSASGLSNNPERNDSSTGLETGQSASQTDSSLLIAQLQSLREHNSASRRVSSVSYADLGVARHDGTRIRGDSCDSDHRPLLDSAASMGERWNHSRASSVASAREPSRSRATLQISHDGRPSTPGSYISQDEGGFLTPQSTAGDLPPEPPSYEDDLSVHGGEAPPYESPTLIRGPQLPAAAHVSDPGSIERAVSPALLISEAGNSSTPDIQVAHSSPDLPHLHLNTSTSSVPPAIQVMQATPIIAFPTSPIPDRRSSVVS